jgi:hypothetical protein
VFRALQLAVGIVAVMIGVVLGVIVAAVWVPCVGAPMPLDPLASPDCVAAAAGGGTAWIGLLLWPIALAVAGFAAVRAIAHGRGPVSTMTVVLLLLVTLVANPLLEYWLLNLRAQSLDDPPGTGVLTALTFVLAGIVLMTTREARTGAPVRRVAAAW